MVRVSLDAFLRSGTLGPIGLGVSRARVRIAVGDPETQSTTSRQHPLPMIWKYGDVELSFDEDDDRLVSIYLNYLPEAAYERFKEGTRSRQAQAAVSESAWPTKSLERQLAAC